MQFRTGGANLIIPGIEVAQAGGDAGFVPVFDQRDDFTAVESAPMASPHTCDVVGTLTLVQNDGQFSASGGKLVFPAQTTPSFGDLGFYGDDFSRINGRAYLFLLNQSVESSGALVGLGAGAGLNVAGMEAAFYGAGAIQVIVNGGGAFTVASAFVAGTDYKLLLIPRASGGTLCLVKGGVYTDWTLLYVSVLGTGSSLRGKFSNFNAVGTLDFFRVVPLPAPFSTSDFGIATAHTASPSANATITSEADAVIEFTWTAVTNEVLELSVRRTDDNNRWILRGSQSGSTIKLIEVAAGVETEKASAAQTWTNGTPYRIVVRHSANTIRAFVADVDKTTYSSATFNNTATGVKVSHAGTDLVAWPFTLGAAAAALLDAVAAA